MTSQERRAAPRSEIVTIGDELLLGFTIDTNAAHLARALARDRHAHRASRDRRRRRPRQIAARRRRGARPHRRRHHDRRPRSDVRRSHQAVDRRAVRPRNGARRRTLSLDGGALAHAIQPPAAGGEPAAGDDPRRARRSSRIITDRRPASGSRTSAAAGSRCSPAFRARCAACSPTRCCPRLAARVTSGTVVRSRTLRTTGIAESLLADQIDSMDGGPLGRVARVPAVDRRRRPPSHRSRRRRSATRSTLIERAAARLRERVGRVDLRRGRRRPRGRRAPDCAARAASRSASRRAARAACSARGSRRFRGRATSCSAASSPTTTT